MPTTFRQLARELPEGGAQVFVLHSAELANYLEALWALRNPQLPADSRRPSKPSAIEPGATVLPQAPWDWDHLIYAYCIENIGIYEIFLRVLHEALNGERLGILSAQSQQWVRNVEDLFFKPPLFSAIYGVESRLRHDPRATRRNAYYRMFGMELWQADDDVVSYVQPQASNRDFVGLFEEFLREVWTGVINEQNSSGTKPTDDLAIANLARRLRQMLGARRQLGTLAREEFFAVAAMSWLHLTVEIDSAIIQDLRAQDTSAAERLKRVGEKVNLMPNTNADSYFQLADPMSRVLTEIESGRLDNPANVPALYTTGRALRADVISVITHWSIVTGRNMKAGRVTVYPVDPALIDQSAETSIRRPQLSLSAPRISRP
jgi:hypothetical protein